MSSPKSRRTGGLTTEQQRRLAELRERKAHGPANPRTQLGGTGRAPSQARMPGHRAR